MEYAASLVDISVSLGGRSILRECSISFEKGFIHCLIGKGGAGKTILIKTLGMLVKPEKGALYIDGQQIDFENKESIKQGISKIAIQFQNMALFDFLDVRSNIAFGLRRRVKEEEIDERVRSALKMIGLEEAGSLSPSELSGGMQRRVAVARAFVTDAKIMVFDDPTSGLDPVTSSRIFKVIHKLLNPNRTIIIVSHDLDRLVSICNRFHVIEHGKRVFSGDFRSLKECDIPYVREFLSL